jgi:hypothetical protein
MDDIHKIKDCLRELAGGTPIETEVAKVLSVDGAVCKVSRVRDGMVIDRVRLNAISTADKGIVVTPKTGTYVLVSRLGEVNWFVTLCGEVEKISIDAEAKIVFNGGHFGGLVRIGVLIEELNRLVETFNTHTHSVPNGTSLAPTPQASGFSSETLEDDNITH